MQIIKNRKIPFIISGVLFALSVLVLFQFGLKQGIDFTGGSLMEVKFTRAVNGQVDKRPDIGKLREVLGGLDIGEVLVQESGSDKIILRMKFLSEDEHQLVLSVLRDEFGEEVELSVEAMEESKNDEEIEIDAVEGVGKAINQNLPVVLEERFETIGPAISTQLRKRSFYAAIAVVLAIILYVGYVFRRVSKPVKSWKYGVTAIIALIHDATITMGVFALLGHFLGVEIGIPFVVALLTIMGYSVNDTIVVFDRVRENLIKRGSEHFAQTVNLGVNQSITRSINTSLTTLLVLVALFFFGGDSIHYFSLALILGITVGTYSSIFLASPLLVVWERLKNK